MTTSTERFEQVENGSISHIVHTHGTWLVRSFNDASHMLPLFTRGG